MKDQNIRGNKQPETSTGLPMKKDQFLRIGIDHRRILMVDMMRVIV